MATSSTKDDCPLSTLQPFSAECTHARSHRQARKAVPVKNETLPPNVVILNNDSIIGLNPPVSDPRNRGTNGTGEGDKREMNG